jgi:hypothetical protein
VLGGITGPPRHGGISRETWFSRLGVWCKADDLAVKPKEVKTKCSLAESSKEGCGSERALLLMRMEYILEKAVV